MSLQLARAASRALPALLAAAVAHAAPPVPSGDGDWPMPARDYANTRYSPLADITARNVATLKPAFTFSTGVLRGHEAAPIVVGGSMYLVTPYPNIVYAIDLSQPGGRIRWRFDPKPDAFAQGVACCDVVNEGLAFANGKVFFNTLDNRTYALDAETCKVKWTTRAGDVHAGETRTTAPLVVGDRVLVGNGGTAFGVRGWLMALDAKSGQELWRAYSTGPDSDVRIGAQYKPFYPQERGTDLGAGTWSAQSWRTGGGTPGWISYDPQLDLIYYGTSNPAPFNAEQRTGDNKFTSGLFARHPTSGEAQWFYQLSPHDEFGYGATSENVLVDLDVAGKPRKALLHADANGYVYVMDRATGELLSATPFVSPTTTIGVDVRTGRLNYAADKHQRTGQVIRNLCPGTAGAKNWQPSAYSPRTKLLYIPHQLLCADAEAFTASYIAGTPYVGAIVQMKPTPSEPHLGRVTAWDPVAATARRTIIEDLPVWSGALVTAGDVLFYGTMPEPVLNCQSTWPLAASTALNQPSIVP